VMAVAVDAPLGRLADPTDTSFVPRPEWYFLFLFETLKFFEGSMEVVGAVVLPTLAIGVLVLLPFLDRGKPAPIGRRKMAFAVAGLAAVGWICLTAAAVITTPEQQVSTAAGMNETTGWTQLTPVELAGAAGYRKERCSTCHNLTEGEPKVGPTLATVGERKSAEWMITHFKNPSQLVPGSPMPPVQASDDELNWLSAFLLKVTPENAAALDNVPGFAMKGAMIYQENKCGACHQVNGAGQSFGPPLNGVGERRAKEWLVEHFRDPKKFEPTSMMPAYDFPADEMEAIVTYLRALPAE
ncbi:MAG: c-type cytochrome, partial [bacterium]|nr:c-type cytochrome [bacterium]